MRTDVLGNPVPEYAIRFFSDDAPITGTPTSGVFEDKIAERDRRIQDLLESNNAYLDRARAAEAEVVRLKALLAGTSEARAVRLAIELDRIGQ